LLWSSLQVECVGNTLRGEGRLNVSCCLQDKGVMTIRRVGVTLGKRVIDEDGKTGLIGYLNCSAYGRIIVDTHRSSHLIEHELAIAL
jgi:hypothetical protein